MNAYEISTKVRKGYELPEWHRTSHATLESAQAEVAKLREWAGFGNDSAILKLEIREA